ncbi:hypothetical protein FQR65_LT13500 [Abscondita terminalis]|nr:hypothetical protein FQR65_LT13500 [Abscondita terminalis]
MYWLKSCLTTLDEDDVAAEVIECAKNAINITDNPLMTEYHENAFLDVVNGKGENFNYIFSDSKDASSKGLIDAFAQCSTSYNISSQKILPIPKTTPSIKKQKLANRAGLVECVVNLLNSTSVNLNSLLTKLTDLVGKDLPNCIVISGTDLLGSVGQLVACILLNLTSLPIHILISVISLLTPVGVILGCLGALLG